MSPIDEWVKQETNHALQSYAEVDRAGEELVRAKLPLHPDHPKNWDNALALLHTVHVAYFNDAILDAGAGDESAYLPGLHKLGYTNLLGCNLDRKDDYTAGEKNGVRHVYADITDTNFPHNCFAFIACLSVIEHGVDWRKFILEMHRILKPGGGLFISFDYWQTKLDTTGLITHDAPLNIFSETEVLHILDFSATVGLHLGWRPWVGSCKDHVISWAGKQYTFGNLLLRKPS